MYLKLHILLMENATKSFSVITTNNNRKEYKFKSGSNYANPLKGPI